MKNLILIFCAICLSISSSFSQPKSASPTHSFNPAGAETIQAIMLGKPDAIRAFLDTQTDYIQDINVVFNSPPQIILQLKKFLSQNPCASLKIVNRGSSEEFAFARADYTANSGDRFWHTEECVKMLEDLHCSHGTNFTDKQKRDIIKA